MKTKKQKEFRKNDKLWHPSRGWGIVDSLHENREAAIDISFKGCLRCVMGEDISLLSFTEYPINANHVRPFEEGDIVYNEIHDIIAIYDSESRGALACKVFLMMQHPNEPVFRINETPGFGVGYTKDYISATPEQKQLLFDRLAQDNLRWNEKTRKLEDIQKPFKHGDILYYDNNKPHRFITIVGNDNREMLFMDIEKMTIHYFWESHISEGAVHATKAQKQLLFGMLAKDGKRWNEETRKLEKLDETAAAKSKKLVVGEDICVMWNSKEEIVIELLTQKTQLWRPGIYLCNGRYKNCIKFDANQNQVAEIWNEEARKLEELNEPKVGDYVIFFDFQKYSTAMVGKLKAIYNNRVYKYESAHRCFENCIKWDGTKEHLDSVRNGIIK